MKHYGTPFAPTLTYGESQTKTNDKEQGIRREKELRDRLLKIRAGIKHDADTVN